MEDFNGDTFVAFIDISGFKELMRKRQKAEDILDKFYTTGYDVVDQQQNENYPKVDGIFISDCGILFVRQTISEEKKFEALLKIIKEINRKMLVEDIMLTTSIAYGYFCYEDRIEFQRIKKNLIYGAAYVTAYLDSDDGNSKIQPGQCRIVKRNLPNEIKTAIGNHNSCILKMVGILQKDNEHYYYYWMLENPSEIEEFERKYYDAYNSQFTEILKVLKEKTRRI